MLAQILPVIVGYGVGIWIGIVLGMGFESNRCRRIIRWVLIKLFYRRRNDE